MGVVMGLHFNIRARARISREYLRWRRTRLADEGEETSYQENNAELQDL
jgi:hypothetical protein